MDPTEFSQIDQNAKEVAMFETMPGVLLSTGKTLSPHFKRIFQMMVHMPMLTFQYSSEKETTMAEMMERAKEAGVPSRRTEEGLIEFDQAELSKFMTDFQKNKPFVPSYDMMGGLNILQSSVSGNFTRRWSRHLSTEFFAESSLLPSMSYLVPKVRYTKDGHYLTLSSHSQRKNLAISYLTYFQSKHRIYYGGQASINKELKPTCSVGASIRTVTDDGIPVHSAAIKLESEKKKVSGSYTRTVMLNEIFALNLGAYVSKSFIPEVTAAAPVTADRDSFTTISETSAFGKMPFVSLGAQVDCRAFPAAVSVRAGSNKDWGVRLNVLIPFSDTWLVMAELGVFHSKSLGGFNGGLQVQLL